MHAPNAPCHDAPDVARVLSEIFAVDDMRALNLFRQLKTIHRALHQLAAEHHPDETKLSHARIHLLIRLEASARLGDDGGRLPSELSAWLGVSRNTVSALLNGLEEQGLIERALHPTDRRQILIRLTDAGRAEVLERAPAFGAFVTRLFRALDDAERATLAALLDKLLAGME